ncbi:MAG: glycosyltransferase family 2 protein [Anaerolineales bacterium]|nr:glycosyltransferase family 2 protein [Anaerolineales bacterium]
MTENPVFLSIVIPAYNEEKRLPDTLDKITNFLEAQTYTYEVLVIENGSTDRTLEIARDYAARFRYIRAIHEDGRGKGLAVRRGMLEARGEKRFMCDADLSMPIQEVNAFLAPGMQQADIVIGSREAPGAVRYNEPDSRHIGGRLVNLVIRTLALPGLHDTQCGFKMFNAESAAVLFPRQTMTGWSLDIELLFIARRHGFSIKELGIPWHYAEFSHVNPVKDAIQMVIDIFNMWFNALVGKYK